jgi:hypothetical protein
LVRCTSGSQRTQVKVLLFNIIAFYINALCTTCDSTCLTLQNRTLNFGPQRIHCIDRLHGTFITSKTSTTNLFFLVWNQVEARGRQVRRIWRMGKNFKATVSCSSHRNVWMCGLAHCRAGAERLESVCPPPAHFTRDFLRQTSQFVCIVRTVYGTTLLWIVNHDYPLTIPKDWIFPSSSLLMTQSWITSEWVTRLLLLLFVFWIEVMDPCFFWVTTR